MNIRKKTMVLFVAGMVIACDTYGMSRNELSSLNTEELKRRAHEAYAGADFSSASKDFLISLLSGSNEKLEENITNELSTLSLEELKKRTAARFGVLDFSNATKDFLISLLSDPNEKLEKNITNELSALSLEELKKRTEAQFGVLELSNATKDSLISLLSSQDDVKKENERQEEESHEENSVSPESFEERMSIISDTDKEYEESVFADFLKKSLDAQEAIFTDAQREKSISENMLTRMVDIIEKQKQDQTRKQAEDDLCKREKISLTTLNDLRKSTTRRLTTFFSRVSQEELDRYIVANKEFQEIKQAALKRKLEESGSIQAKEKSLKSECKIAIENNDVETAKTTSAQSDSDKEAHRNAIREARLKHFVTPKKDDNQGQN